MALTTINSSDIKDDSIVNADIKSDAAIALSKLASTPAVLTGSTNNTITTVTAANTIQGEANLTFDGTTLNVATGGLTAGQKVTIAGSGNAAGDDLTINNWGNADGEYWVIGTNITSNAGGSTAKTNDTNRSAAILLDGRIGRMVLSTSQSGTSTTTDTHTWDREGNYTLTGNVVVANGKGIDFSANSNAAGMTSELLDGYEEGVWTPTFFIGGNQATYSTGGQQGRYTKIGRLIYCQFMVDLATKGSGGSSSAVSIAGLPFTSTNDSGDRMNGVVTYLGAFTGLDTGGIVLYNTTNSTAVTLYDAESTYTRTVKGENVENSSHLRGYCWYHC
jgi:hypothetical protein